jgi:hypothetical protein
MRKGYLSSPLTNPDDDITRATHQIALSVILRERKTHPLGSKGCGFCALEHRLLSEATKIRAAENRKEDLLEKKLRGTSITHRARAAELWGMPACITIVFI